MNGAEALRIDEDARGRKRWKQWGPYLAERQWGTVREDYSADGSAWEYFPHDHARSRAYRWGEDGLLGLSDDTGRLCFALALWNGRDPILKERFFGLTGPEGNHGEDVKECYYFVDATPTASYLKAIYKYPQREYPYAELVAENRRRGLDASEFELADAGAFDDDRYFDVTIEYAKNDPDDIHIRISVTNRGPDAADLHVLPTLWFRNVWSWGRVGEHYGPRPMLRKRDAHHVIVETEADDGLVFAADHASSGEDPTWMFTENETNNEKLFGSANASPYVKDAFHRYLISGDTSAVNPAEQGSKAAAHYELHVGAGQTVSMHLRIAPANTMPTDAFSSAFTDTFTCRIQEADAFYAERIPKALTGDERRVARQAYAGLLWTKQFYYFDVGQWQDGDPGQPTPPASRREGRNADWRHLNNADLISMPDTWEYPWYAAWDLAFHTLPFARIDADFAKAQLVLVLREWYMHPNGQIPAYEFAFGDVNPPVHAWAVWRVYKMTAARGERDLLFLERTFHKLLLNFTWWVNRKDPDGKNLFSGGFLGLDNIGVFDRSRPLPTGGHLEQADGTAWMAFYCGTMLSIALELAKHNPAYEDVATKFFEHFIAIADAMNSLGGTGLWDNDDGFYYDQLHVGTSHVALKVRSMVGLIPLFACEVLEEDTLQALPDFAMRVRWFVENRPELARYAPSLAPTNDHNGSGQRRLIAIPTRERLERVLHYLLDESEFLSPYGIRSVSRVHKDSPYTFHVDTEEFRVTYDRAESTSGLFGGNSNWRGPVWFPLNYLLIEALEKYYHVYGDSLMVECPTHSGNMRNLGEVAVELSTRLARIFLPDADGHRPVHGGDASYATDDAWKDLVLFYEYFDGDNGRGVGASHQTGWTALVTRCLENVATERERGTTP